MESADDSQRRAGDLGGVAGPKRVAVQAPVDDVHVAAASCTEAVRELPAIDEMRNERSRVLGEVQPIAAGRAHDLEPAVGAVLHRVLPLLHARLETVNARQGSRTG